MKVGIGNVGETADIPPDNISVQFQQSPQKTHQKILIYYMDSAGVVGKIELTPFEFMKVTRQGQDLLIDNKVKV